MPLPKKLVMVGTAGVRGRIHKILALDYTQKRFMTSDALVLRYILILYFSSVVFNLFCNEGYFPFQ